MSLRNRLHNMYAQHLDALLNRPRMREDFLPQLTDIEEAALIQQFVPVAVAAALWCRSSRILDPRIVEPLALITIAPFADSPTSALLERMKGAIWFYAIDDMIDGPGTAFSRIVPAIDDSIRVALAQPGTEKPRTKFGKVLMKMKGELSTYSTFPDLMSYWATSLARTLDSMVFEYWTNNRYTAEGAERGLPSMEEYLYFGRHSIVNAHLMTTALIVEDDPSLISVAGELMDLATRCGGPIRLANDLASYSRERDERKFNSVILGGTGREPGDSPSDNDTATTAVVQRIRRERLAAHRLADDLPSHRQIGRKLIRSMDLCVDLYLLRDYRLWEREIEARHTESSQVSEAS